MICDTIIGDVKYRCGQEGIYSIWEQFTPEELARQTVARLDQLALEVQRLSVLCNGNESAITALDVRVDQVRNLPNVQDFQADLAELRDQLTRKNPAWGAF